MRKRTRIVWNPEELFKVALEFVRLRKRGIYKLEALRLAQSVLDPGRVRTFKTISNVHKDWESYVEKAHTQIEAEEAAAVLAAAAPKQPELHSIIEGLINLIIDEVTKRPDLAERVADIVVKRMKQSLSSVVVTKPTLEHPVHAPSEKKLTVVIAGMQEKQRIQLQGEFPMIKLKTITKATPAADVTNIVHGADYVLGMTSFMSHSLDAKLTKLCKATKNYSHVSGGMTQFRHKLRVIIATR